jgi:hypothetical protein
MFLTQIFHATDVPLTKVNMSPGMGMVLLGQNISAKADLTKSHKGMLEEEETKLKSHQYCKRIQAWHTDQLVK